MNSIKPLYTISDTPEEEIHLMTNFIKAKIIEEVIGRDLPPELVAYKYNVEVKTVLILLEKVYGCTKTKYNKSREIS